MLLERQSRRPVALSVRETFFDMKTTPSHFHPTFSTLLRKGLRWTALPLAAFGLVLVPAVRADMVVGSGNLKTETREVKGFHALDLSAFGNVVVTQGDTEGLTVEGEDNLLPLVTTEVDGKGTLHLGMKSGKGSVRATKPLTFKLATKGLDQVTISGSGNFDAQSLTEKEKGNLDVAVTGSGNVKIGTLSADGLKVSLQGSGTLTLGGSVNHQDVTLSGSGDYDTAELKTKTTTFKLSGSGDAEVWATDKLTVESSGSGDVSYYGKPTVEKHVSGSGSVDGLGDKGSREVANPKTS